MPSPQKRKICYRVQFKQVRTDHTEKISHHQVGVPDRLQLRQAVEDINRLPAPVCDLFVQSDGKRFKSDIGIELQQMDSRQIFDQRIVLGKAHVSDIASVFDSLPHKRPGKHRKFTDICHLPHDIIAETDIIQYFVELRKAASDAVKCCHNIPLSFLILPSM